MSELLARLTARGIDTTSVGRSTNPEALDSGTNVAGSLAGIDDRSITALYHLYTGHPERKLKAYLFTHAIKIGARENWKTPTRKHGGKRLIERLCEMVMEEHSDPNLATWMEKRYRQYEPVIIELDRLGRANPELYVQIESHPLVQQMRDFFLLKSKAPDLSKGGRWTDEVKAFYLHLPVSTWRGTWKKRYEVIYQQAIVWASYGHSALKEHYRKDVTDGL